VLDRKVEVCNIMMSVPNMDLLWSDSKISCPSIRAF